MSSNVEGRNVQSVNLTLEAMKEVGQKEQQELRAEQQESVSAFQNSQEEAINPFAAKFATKQKEIKSHKTRIQKMLKGGETGKRLLPIEQIKDSASQFQKRNPELIANILVALRERIKPGDTKEDILRTLAEFYPDVSLGDEVLEFLLATTEGDLAKTIAEAKEEFDQLHAREITAGRNIGLQARQAAEKGLGTASSLRDMYREVTGNPRDSTTLFEELSTKYEFKDLKKVVDFLLHSLGADMKSKGPSIPRGMLHRLLTETRSLQAILGVYRFFRSRMRLVNKMFKQEGLEVPSQLTFETISKEFMALAAERYPSSAKVLQSAVRLGIEKWIAAKIIVFSQLRDGIREVAMAQIYKTLQHRDELYLAILEALEDLEDQLEELAEREDNEEDEGDDEEEEEEEVENDKDSRYKDTQENQQTG
jgi:type III secretion protein W